MKMAQETARMKLQRKIKASQLGTQERKSTPESQFDAPKGIQEPNWKCQHRCENTRPQIKHSQTKLGKKNVKTSEGATGYRNIATKCAVFACSHDARHYVPVHDVERTRTCIKNMFRPKVMGCKLEARSCMREEFDTMEYRTLHRGAD